MDTGGNISAGNPGGAKEERYVTLEVGSKISGYTKDYLERLCRLDKVECRSRMRGGFVIPLEALLRETQTSLDSYDGIDFINKKELVALPSERLTAETHSPAQTSQGSFGGQATSQPPLHADEWDALFASSPQAPSPAQTSQGSFGGQAPTSLRPISSVAPSSRLDEWDALFLGGRDETTSTVQNAREATASSRSLYETPSSYRSISTSADPEPYRDSMPLFPFPSQVPMVTTAALPRVPEERHPAISVAHSLTRKG